MCSDAESWRRGLIEISWGKQQPEHTTFWSEVSQTRHISEPAMFTFYPKRRPIKTTTTTTIALRQVCNSESTLIEDCETLD